MSSQITDMISYIGNMGAQDTSRFQVTINGFDISPSVLSVKLPSPRIEFMKVNYWNPNPEFFLPYGFKYSEYLLLEMLMPEVTTWSGVQNPNANNFINYLPTYFRERYKIGNQGTFFGQFASGSGSGADQFSSFTWLKNQNNLVTVSAYTRDNTVIKSYQYKNCFLEKIMPIEFDAAKADIQTFTVSFVVSEM